jgi:hypothetical protein
MTADTDATEAADDPKSHIHIDLDDKEAVERWTKALSITDEALCAAVKEVGTRIDRIKDYLGAGSASEQVDG